jgi:hypothetical protein
MQVTVNLFLENFREEREKLVAWNSWAMESLGGLRRDYVFESWSCGRCKLTRPPLQAMRSCMLQKTCKKMLNSGAPYT